MTPTPPCSLPARRTCAPGSLGTRRIRYGWLSPHPCSHCEIPRSILRRRTATPSRELRSPRDQVDLDPRAACQRRHANARPGRAALWWEVLGIDAVHRLVVVLEVCQEDAHREYVCESETAAGEHLLQIRQHLPRLGLDALWIGGVVGEAGERQLAGDEDPAILLDGVAKRRDRLGGARDHVEERGTHRVSLAYRIVGPTPGRCGGTLPGIGGTLLTRCIRCAPCRGCTVEAR